MHNLHTNCINLDTATVSAHIATNGQTQSYSSVDLEPMSRQHKKLNFHRSNSNAFTLVELLVVVAIIGVLIAILIPAINFVQYQSHATDAANTIKTVHLAVEQYTLKTSMPLYPDNPPTADRYVGFLKYNPDASTPADQGVLGILSKKQLFTPATEPVDDDGLMLDPWGEPFHYVKGNSANKKSSATYDANLPQDTNKPKDANLTPKESDWNIDDKNGFTYIYSIGDSSDDADWIYIKDSRGDY